MSFATSKGREFFVREYEELGKSISQIAASESVTTTTIRNALISFNIERRVVAKLSDEDKRKILAMDDDGCTVSDIANTINRSQQAVRSVLTPQSIIKPPISKDVLHQWYVIDGKSGPELASELDVNTTTIYNWLNAYDIPRDSKPFHATVPKDELIDMYIHHNMSTYDIADNFDVDVQKIQYTLNYYGIPIKPTGWNTTTRAQVNYPNIALLTDRNWLSAQKLTKTNREIHKEFNVPEGSVQYYSKLYGIPSNFVGSSYERLLRGWLDEVGINYEVNSRQVISPYEVDIYIPDHNVAIEVNGRYWHSTIHSRIDIDYHKRKTKLALDAGIKLIQVWDNELDDDVKYNIIKTKILHACNMNKDYTVYARRCEVQTVPISIQRKFMANTHIQGYSACSICYGLYHNGIMVALIGFKDNSNGSFYLNRYCTIGNVVGGFSKLLSHFRKNHKWNTIDTFANMRFSTSDNVYEKMGFTHSGWGTPNVFYSKGHEVKSRQQSQASKLRKWMAEYDPQLSQHQNMITAGWIPVYDCGHTKYTITNTQPD